MAKVMVKGLLFSHFVSVMLVFCTGQINVMDVIFVNVSFELLENFCFTIIFMNCMESESLRILYITVMRKRCFFFHLNSGRQRALMGEIYEKKMFSKEWYYFN